MTELKTESKIKYECIVIIKKRHFVFSFSLLFFGMDAFWFRTLHLLTIAFHCAVGAAVLYCVNRNSYDDRKRDLIIAAAVLGVVSLLAIAPFARERIVKSRNKTHSWGAVKWAHFLTIAFHLLISGSWLLVALTEDPHLEYWGNILAIVLIVVSLKSSIPILMTDYTITRKGGEYSN